MKNNLSFERVWISRESSARLRRIADGEGRSKQRQMGMWLERLADLASDEDKRAKLRELGLLSELAA